LPFEKQEPDQRCWPEGSWPRIEGRDSTEVSKQISEQVNAKLGDKPPQGGVFHAEGPAEDGGWWVFDVWKSKEDYEAFNREILGPALASAGIGAGNIRWLDVAWDSSQMGPPA
jgi:hypothetical protein